MKRAFILFTILAMMVSFGWAQQRTGNIYGKAVDENNQPLPGVTMTLTSDLIGEMSFITTARGVYRFLSLSPGTYTIKAELSGFNTMTREAIVQTGGNVTIDFTLQPQSLQEEVTVTAASPVVDTKKTTISMNMTVEELQSIPTARDPWVILELTPGVVVDRANVGGSESGQQSNMVSRGIGRGATNWNLDGIDATDQVSVGASSQYYDFDAFDEIQIQTAATDITSFTAGAQVNLVTKRGGNKLQGGGRFYWAGEALQGENTPADFDLEANKTSAVLESGLNLGGPIIRNKVWFWMGGGYQNINVVDVAGVDIVTKIYNFEIKLNTQLGKHRLETFFNFTDNPKDGRVASSAIDAYESRYKQSGPKPIFKIQDEISVNENLFFSLKGSYAGFGFKLDPIGGYDALCYRDQATGRYSGTYRYGSDYGRTQLFGQAMGVLFADNFLGTSHEMKFGAEFKHSFGERDRTYVPYYLYYRDIEALTTYRTYIYRPKANYDYRINRFGVFFQDTVDLSSRLTLLASLRFDRQWSYTLDVSVGGSNVSWAGDFNLPPVEIAGRDHNVIWNTFSPRLGLIYKLTADGKTTAKLNFGIYGDRYDSGFVSGLVSTYGYSYFTWKDLNGDMDVQDGEVSSGRFRDSVSDLDPEQLFDSDMTSPKTLEMTAGVERELFENVAVGGTFIYRKNYNTYWTLNYVSENGQMRLPTPDDWVTGGYIPAEWGGYPWYEYRDGISYETDDFTFNRPDYYERFISFELSFKKRFSRSSPWLINGSFSFQDWRRFYPTRASYNDPTNVEQLDGEYAGYTSSSSGATEQSMNPRWMAKLGFAYQFPYRINLGGTLVARDGFISRERYIDYDVERNEIEDNPSVYAGPYGSHRLPTFFLLNLRLDKTFAIGEKLALTIAIDAFNIFNANTTLSHEDIVSRDTYQQIFQYISPRIFRIGARFRF
jgi:hypothetical protein